jgi:hypothetical protein
MATAIRVAWSEVRDRQFQPELFFLIADIGECEASLCERSTWETGWYSCCPSPIHLFLVECGCQAATLHALITSERDFTIRLTVNPPRCGQHPIELTVTGQDLRTCIVEWSQRRNPLVRRHPFQIGGIRGI